MTHSADYVRPKRYRKKPVVIEACLLTEANRKWVAEWCGGVALAQPAIEHLNNGAVLGIDTLEGRMWARFGEYVIKGVQGEFYPCKADIFEATYEAEHNDGSECAP